MAYKTAIGTGRSETANTSNNIAGKDKIQSSMTFSIRMFSLLIIVILATIFCDQTSKFWASYNLNMVKPVNIFGDYLRVVLRHNFGMIFGIPIRVGIVYYIFPIIGIVVIFYLAFRTKVKFLIIAFGLIIGGALGNLIDRIRLGYVIDYIDMGIKNARWPTYNLADLAIVIGLIMIIAREIFKRPSSMPNI